MVFSQHYLLSTIIHVQAHNNLSHITKPNFHTRSPSSLPSEQQNSLEGGKLILNKEIAISKSTSDTGALVVYLGHTRYFYFLCVYKCIYTFLYDASVETIPVSWSATARFINLSQALAQLFKQTTTSCKTGPGSILDAEMLWEFWETE